MPFGTEAGLSPCHIVLDWEPSSPQTWHTTVLHNIFVGFYHISLPENYDSYVPLNHQSRWLEGVVDDGQRQRPVGFNHAGQCWLVNSVDHSGVLILNSAFRGWFRSSHSSNIHNVHCAGAGKRHPFKRLHLRQTMHSYGVGLKSDKTMGQTTGHLPPADLQAVIWPVARRWDRRLNWQWYKPTTCYTVTLQYI